MADQDNKQTSFNDDKKFYILGDFNDEVKKQIAVPLTKKIEELSKVKDAEIEVWINSPGGDGYLVMHLVQLIEMAKSKGIKVKTVVPQFAFSCGSILAITGTVGERYIGNTAEHLPHYGAINAGWRYTPLQIERTAEFSKRWFGYILAHYQKYSKIPKLEEQMKDDNFFIPADKCIEWGLADKYMGDL